LSSIFVFVNEPVGVGGVPNVLREMKVVDMNTLAISIAMIRIVVLFIFPIL
jgi:hypothetical protein